MQKSVANADPSSLAKSASVDRAERAAYANMERHKRPLQIVHLKQERPIRLENMFEASGVFTRRSTGALRMSATGRVSQTVEISLRTVNKILAADGAYTRNGIVTSAGRNW